MDEFARIRAWTGDRQPAELLASAGVRLGIGDDAAVVASPPGREWLLAMDTMVEHVHFAAGTMRDEDVGYKALAANVSDIAAMGGVPHHALVSVSVPPDWGEERMRKLFDGLYECADAYRVAVVGGDTTSSPSGLVVAVTVVGSAEAGRAITRSGAGAGDIVFVTGAVGLSAGGLHGLLANAGEPRRSVRPVPAPPERLVRAHRRPEPSVAAGRLLAERRLATALNDVSDGLASEAWEIAEASGVRLVLEESALPLSGELSRYASACGASPLDWMLYGGEDYVLLGTAAAGDEDALRAAFREAGLPLFVIGTVEAGTPGVALISSAGGMRRAIEKRGYNHFARD